MSIAKEDLARATEGLRELRRMQTGIMALQQQITTMFEAFAATDWEDRYVAEGLIDVERIANGETPAS